MMMASGFDQSTVKSKQSFGLLGMKKEFFHWVEVLK
jgi:hypothetical protein